MLEPPVFVSSKHFADVFKMADEDNVGLFQFLIIVVVSIVFGGVLILLVLSVGGRKSKDDQVSANEKTEEEKKAGKEDIESEKKDNIVQNSKSTKRSTNNKEHPKQYCILKGHTSDVLYIEFTSNGKILGSTSSGVNYLYFIKVACGSFVLAVSKRCGGHSILNLTLCCCC